MKKLHYIIYLLIVSFMLILESTLFSRLNIFNIKPNLVLIITIILTFFINYEQSVIYSLIGGALEDFFIGRMIGMNIITMVLVVLIILKFSSRIIKENLITPLLLIFIASLINGIIIAFLMFIIGDSVLISFIYIKNLLIESFCNLLISIIIYPLIYLIFHKFKKEEI